MGLGYTPMTCYEVQDLRTEGSLDPAIGAGTSSRSDLSNADSLSQASSVMIGEPHFGA